MKRNVYKQSQGFSLIEVLVFISVLTVALVALIGSVTYSSLVLNDARYRLFATRYNEELAEWLKFQREYYQYQSIVDQISNSAGTTYCFNTDSLNWPSPGACPSNDYSLNNFYKRELMLINSTGQIDVEITTSYWLLNQEKSSTITLTFNEYDF